MTTRWVSLVIHGVVLEHQSQPGGVESGQPNDIQYPVDVAVRSHSIVRTDSLDTRQPITFTDLIEITKSNGMDTISGFGCLTGSQEIVVLIIDLSTSGQQGEPVRVSAPKQLCTHACSDGICVGI